MSERQSVIGKPSINGDVEWHVDHSDYRESYEAAVEQSSKILGEEISRKITIPGALALPGKYVRSSPRLMIMGQETLGAHVMLANTKKYDAWSAAIGGTIAFNHAYGTEQETGPFWKMFQEAAETVGLNDRRSIAWSNIIKVQLLNTTKSSNSISKLSAEQTMAVVRWQRDLFIQEMKFAAPDIVLMLTGGLTWAATHLMDSRETLLASDAGRVGILKSPLFPQTRFVFCNHPNARMEKQARVTHFQTALDALKRAFDDAR